MGGPQGYIEPWILITVVLQEAHSVRICQGKSNTDLLKRQYPFSKNLMFLFLINQVKYVAEKLKKINHSHILSNLLLTPGQENT